MAPSAKDQLDAYIRITGENGAKFALIAMELLDQLAERADDPGNDEEWATGLTMSAIESFQQFKFKAECDSAAVAFAATIRRGDCPAS